MRKISGIIMKDNYNNPKKIVYAKFEHEKKSEQWTGNKALGRLLQKIYTYFGE